MSTTNSVSHLTDARTGTASTASASTASEASRDSSSGAIPTGPLTVLTCLDCSRLYLENGFIAKTAVRLWSPEGGVMDWCSVHCHERWITQNFAEVA